MTKDLPITQLDNLMIASDKDKGTNNIYASFSLPCMTTEQRDKLENIEPYFINENRCTVKVGTMIYNIDKQGVEVWRIDKEEGVWAFLYASQKGEDKKNISDKTTNLKLDATDPDVDILDGMAFFLPVGEGDLVEADQENLYNGFIYYNSSTNSIRAYIKDKFQTLFATNTGTSGAGLNYSPIVIPKGYPTDVEVADNEVNGFIYYNANSKAFRTYIGGKWQTVATMADSSSFLDDTTDLNSTPIVLPRGSRSLVEKPTTLDNGFMYHNNTDRNIRVVTKSQWQTVYSSDTKNAGVGLDGTPLVISRGPKTDVEVIDNAVDALMYFDTTTNLIKTFITFFSTDEIEGTQWQTISTLNTGTSGAGLKCSPIVIPKGYPTDVEVADNEVNGFIYYNANSKDFRAYLNSQWRTVFLSDTGTAGAGLIRGSPFVLPNGNSVEGPANSVNGFIYYNTHSNLIRAYINGTWRTLYYSPLGWTAGTGLSGVAFAVPTGSRASVEVSDNQWNGLIYYDTTNNALRTYNNSQWRTVFSSDTGTATGVGLTSGSPLVMPKGPAAAVEVAGNNVSGFLYYDTTGNTLRINDAGTWKTINPT